MVMMMVMVMVVMVVMIAMMVMVSMTASGQEKSGQGHSKKTNTAANNSGYGNGWWTMADVVPAIRVVVTP